MNFKEFLGQYQKVQVEQFTHQVSEKPLLSVCVQTYQHVNFIKQCLDGILMQETNFDFEILLGEDASTDGTREICTDYAQKHPDKIRLFLHHRENNIAIGWQPTGRFNLMYNLFSANGKYIALCEGDDYWTDPLKLQKQVDFLEANEGYVACYHSCSVVDENGTLIRKDKWNTYKNHNSEDLLHGNGHLITSTVMYRNLINFPIESMKVKNADTVLWHLLGFHGAAKFIDTIAPSMYRIHGGGIWSMKDKYHQLTSGLKTYDFMADNLKANGKKTDSIHTIVEGMLNDFLISQLAHKNFKNYGRGVKILIKNKLIRKAPFFVQHLTKLIRIFIKKFN